MCALPYFDVRDCLSIVDGILVKGKAVVIPMALRPSREKTTQCPSRPRQYVASSQSNSVLANIASDIKQIADMYESCQEMKPQNLQEPLKQHSDGDETWQKIGL